MTDKILLLLDIVSENDLFDALFFFWIISFITTLIFYYVKEGRWVRKRIRKMEEDRITNFDDKIEDYIKTHHELAIKQARTQSTLSVIAVIVGSLVILDALYTSSVDLNIPKLVAGVITEAISILFLSQSKETRQQSTDFLNRLRQDRQYRKSLEIAESIQDEQLRNKLKVEVALHLSNITQNSADL